MKRNMIKQALKWNSISKLLILLLLVTNSSMAQELTKTFTQDLEIGAKTTIMTKGPRAMGFNMHGTINSVNRDGSYVITSGKSTDEPTLVINDFQIFTWEEQKIRQTIDISLLPAAAAPQEAQALMDQLAISLQKEASGRVKIDANMNISQFKLVNGLFRKDFNAIVLENGQQHRIKSITITSRLYVPQNANLEIDADYVSMSIGDLHGQLKLNVTGGSIDAGDVQELDAKLQFCEVRFEDLGEAKVEAQNSLFEANHVGALLIGKEQTNQSEKLEWPLFPETTSKSSLNEYNIQEVEQLSIQQSINDKFILGTVGKLESSHSTFSNYQLQLLTKELYLQAKNGDLQIDEIANDFQQINIDNHFSEVELNLRRNKNFLLRTYPNQYTEYQFPKGLQLLEAEKKWDKSFLRGDQNKAGKIQLRCESCTILVKG